MLAVTAAAGVLAVYLLVRWPLPAPVLVYAAFPVLIPVARQLSDDTYPIVVATTATLMATLFWTTSLVAWLAPQPAGSGGGPAGQQPVGEEPGRGPQGVGQHVVDVGAADPREGQLDQLDRRRQQEPGGAPAGAAGTRGGRTGPRCRPRRRRRPAAGRRRAG